MFADPGAESRQSASHARIHHQPVRDEEIGLKAVSVVLSMSNGIFEQIVAQVIQLVKQHVSDFFIRGQQAGVFRSG